MTVELPLSVWTTAQTHAREQREGRYVPESVRHPARMLPAIARAAIAAYTCPGDIVLDPMCGVGTTLVEAAQLDRVAIGIEYEPEWACRGLAGLVRVGEPRLRQ
jgi:modification methylase